MLMLRLILAVIVSLLYACSAEASSEKSTKHLTEADDGRLIELEIGGCGHRAQRCSKSGGSASIRNE